MILMKIVAENKRAYHDYEIIEKLEAGIVLRGNEVRAIREGKASLVGSFGKVLGGELWLINCHIGVLDEPERNRKLLVTKSELNRLIGKNQEKKLVIVALRMYFKNNVCKVEIGLCRSLKKYDKREIIKKRDLDREMTNN